MADGRSASIPTIFQNRKDATASDIANQLLDMSPHDDAGRIPSTRANVTEQKANEVAVGANEERYHTVANNISQLAWMSDASGSLFWYNQRWLDYTGTTIEAMALRGWDAHHPDHIDRVKESWAQALVTSHPWEETYPLRGRDGYYRWFLSRARPVYDDSGKVACWVGTNTDVTAQRGAEDALRRSQYRLEQALAVKNEFLGMVSHELRTPLTPIVGMANALARGLDRPEDVKEAAAVLVESARRLQALLENMLIMARLDSDEAEGTMEPVLMSHVIRRAVERHSEQYPQRPLAMTESTETPIVEGNAGWIGQVVENLLSNAEKYSGDGAEVTVALEVTGTEVVVRVADSGRGITEEQAGQVFEPFYPDPATSNKVSGAGLGLAVCKRLVELQGGRIWARPGESRGAEFGFALPIALDI